MLAANDILGDVDQTAGHVTGVSGLQSGIGQTLTGTVGGNEVLKHAQTLTEVGGNGALDNLTGGLGHKTTHTGELLNLSLVTTSTGVHHHVERAGHGRAFVVFQLGVEFLLDSIRRRGPDVHHLFIAFAVGDKTFLILLGHLGHLIVSGGNQGIELACKVLCNEGDIVLCEDPSFIGALNAFRSNGAITKGIPLRDDGIDTEILEATLAADRAGENKIKMLYLIPTFHNPAGITTSLEVRKKIYEIALKYELIILEDNPYGELRFAGEEIPTIKSMDTEGLVLYCSSFSKVLSAGMRVGFIVGPEKLMQKLVVAKQVEDVHTNQLFQMLCHRFVTERDLDGHIDMIRAIYRRKCAIMMKGLDENLPKSFKFTRPEGGLFVWCTLPDGIDMTEFVARCLKNKLAIVPGTAFCPDENGTSNSVRFNYSTPSDEQIERGCVILGNVAREMLAEIK